MSATVIAFPIDRVRARAPYNHTADKIKALARLFARELEGGDITKLPEYNGADPLLRALAEKIITRRRVAPAVGTA